MAHGCLGLIDLHMPHEHANVQALAHCKYRLTKLQQRLQLPSITGGASLCSEKMTCLGPSGDLVWLQWQSNRKAK